MRPLLRLLAPFLLGLWLSTPAQAQIQRCVGADGQPVFTDRPCAAVGASALTARQRAQADAPLPPSPPAALSLCAADVDELRQSLLDAFADHRANRIADLTLWQGHGRGAAIADLQALDRLLHQPLLGLRREQADPAGGGEALVASTPSEAADGSPRQTRFAILHRSGCLWLGPAG